MEAGGALFDLDQLLPRFRQQIVVLGSHATVAIIASACAGP